MNCKYIIISLVISAFTLLSCNKDPIAEDVYKMEKPIVEQRNYSLEISLQGAQSDKDYYIVAQNSTHFNSRGESEDISIDKYLIKEEFLKDGKIKLSNLKPYYKQTLYFNVLEKKDDTYKLVTNTASELTYNVIFGNHQANINLETSAEARIKQTKITFNIPSEYLGKSIYLVPTDIKEKFEKAIKEGSVNDELFIYHKDKVDENTYTYLNTPRKEQRYLVYIIKPNSELPFIYKEVLLTTDSSPITIDVNKEEKKIINISITRGNDKFDKAEVYLIDSDKWKEVQAQMTENHGSPEKGTYMMKTISNNGEASFQLYQTEGERNLVILVPKWNSSYYDSFEIRRLTINAETQTYNVDITAEFNPQTGGGAVEVLKTITFNVSANIPNGYRLNPYASYAYVIKDASMFSEAWKAITEGRTMDGLYKSEDIVADASTTVTIKDCEIDTSKEIIVLVYGFKGFFSATPIIKRISGSSLKDNPTSVTVDTVEYP